MRNYGLVKRGFNSEELDSSCETFQKVLMTLRSQPDKQQHDREDESSEEIHLHVGGLEKYSQIHNS